MPLELSYFIEEISAFHPNLELNNAILSAVGVMKDYSEIPYNFTLKCHDIASELFNVPNQILLNVYWRNETQIRAENILRTYQRNRIVEDAAIAIACILFPKIVNFELEVAYLGERADYWTTDRRYMVEISGTERAREFRSRHRKKIKQFLQNPYGKGGFVVVCDFSKKRILLSFHTYGRG
jgi:hypothetical protein